MHLIPHNFIEFPVNLLFLLFFSLFLFTKAVTGRLLSRSAPWTETELPPGAQMPPEKFECVNAKNVPKD